MATWSDQLFQTLEGEQAIEGRYSDKAKERTFHHGPNCHRQFAWRPNICPQSVLVHTAGTPLAAGMGPYMFPMVSSSLQQAATAMAPSCALLDLRRCAIASRAIGSLARMASRSASTLSRELSRYLRSTEASTSGRLGRCNARMPYRALRSMPGDAVGGSAAGSVVG